jgi:hypothetical protein
MESLRDEELFDAVALMEKEYKREDRDTPKKMAVLISSNFDVKCKAKSLKKYFNK